MVDLPHLPVPGGRDTDVVRATREAAKALIELEPQERDVGCRSDFIRFPVILMEKAWKQSLRLRDS